MKTFCTSLLLVLPFWQPLFASSAPAFVVGWGENIAGQAIGTPTESWANKLSVSGGLVKIANHVLGNTVAISAGESHSLALRADGTVSGWGANFYGEATGFSTEYPYKTNGQVSISGQVLRYVASISAGCGFSLAVKADGTVVAWGQGAEKARSHVIVPRDLSNVVAVAAGCNYSMALKKDGTVVGWGARQVPADLSNIVAIAAGGEYHAPSLALRDDGVVIDWRPDADYQSGRVATTNAIAIAAGPYHCLALRRDGTVFGWWGNGGGEATGVPTTNGSYTASGLVTLGGQVSSNVVAIAAGNGFSLGLKSDGTVVAWGRMNNGILPATVPAGLSNVVAITAGGNFCLAITTNAAVAERFSR